MKKTSLALMLGLAGMSGLVSANDGYSYTCAHSHKQRVIEVIYLKRESEVPCEVRYTKGQLRHGDFQVDSEETVWKASYEKGYCEAKAAEFVKKQEGWGWACALDKTVKDDTLPEDGREG
ncbi:MAG: hypothetical protein ACR2PT_15685 [Endozoicomonas sp.]